MKLFMLVLRWQMRQHKRLFTASTPNTHIDIYRVRGDFTTGNITGNTSGALWSINTVSDTATMDDAFEDIVDNNRIETESDGSSTLVKSTRLVKHNAR
jgi:hypothetical protein